MNWVEILKPKFQVKTIWDFGRILLSYFMSGTGAILVSMLIFNSIGITSKTSILVIFCVFLPLFLLAYAVGSLLLKVFLRFREKCKNEWDFWMIMLSFSLAGMFIMPVRKFIFHVVGITTQTPLWIKILVYIPIIPPTYYVGLLFFGTILGQFPFFSGMISARLRFLSGRKNIKH